MSRVLWRPVLALVGGLALATSAQAQTRPYIGFVYPAGGQQGTTFPIRLGGQGLDGVNEVLVSGGGVQAKIVEYFRRLNNQETALLSEQVRDLKRAQKEKAGPAPKNAKPAPQGRKPEPGAAQDDAAAQLIARIEKQLAETVQTPACASLSSLVFVEVTLAPDAAPGPREIRLATLRGVSNPLVFHVGQLPETTRKPMRTALLQVLGKEESALRKRPPEEVENRITVPCTVNGQIASGEVNRYRFEARKGQRLVIATEARRLIPYIADAVPGWFQPVLALYDAQGKEVAYNDDYRFKPDPVILFEVPKDGEYAFTITDAIYRGREDFVYRASIGEFPFVTSIFPLGRRVGAAAKVEMKGWNLQQAELTTPAADAEPGWYAVTARRAGVVSNRLPFAVDALPEASEKEPNNDVAHAQKVSLPIIVNGRINRPDDWDVFQIAGHAGDAIVAEVSARRLDSPLDSLVKLTDAAGKVLAFNDDHEDAAAGVNTHHADSYLMFQLPADGNYFVHLGDTARAGGEEYAYRLRLSQPEPDFALRVVPSSVAFRSKNNNAVSVYALRKDGFKGDIKLGLKDPPEGFSAAPVTLSAKQDVVRLTVKTDLVDTKQHVTLGIEGRAKIEDQELVRQAVPAEDRMQAFLWKHLVPAEELAAVVYDPSYEPPPKRVRTSPPAEAKPAEETKPPAEAKPGPEAKPSPESKPPAAPQNPSPPKSKFTKQQVAGRLRQIKILYAEGLLTDDFYDRKVAECEAQQ